MNEPHRSDAPLYGLLAEFASADALLAAARALRGELDAELEAYTPFPVEGLDEVMALPPNRVPLAALLGGMVGGVGGYFMQWYSAVVSYPINVGGRPLHSWPAFIVPTFELTILGAALTAVAAMLIANGLPRLNHPLFAVRDFGLATRDRFFLCVRARPQPFDAERARAALETQAPMRIEDVWA